MRRIVPFAVLLLLLLGGCRQKASAPADAVGNRIDSAAVALRGEEIRAAKRLLAFDLDGTLTQHRTPLSPENRALLDTLSTRYEVVMVVAGNCPRVYGQMGEYPVRIIGNYGMQESVVEDGVFKIIREDTSPVDTAFFLRETDRLRKKYGYTVYKGDPVEFHASGMVTFGLLGTAADKADKLVFDPDRAKRRAMYPEVLEVFKDFAVYIGGSSSFDFVPRQYNKFDATMRYAREHGYSEEEVLFIGDDFDDGGGDSHVRILGMDYVQVTDYTALPRQLSFLL